MRSRRAPVLGLQHPVPVRSQVDPQRAPDLRVVVDDQHPRLITSAIVPTARRPSTRYRGTLGT